MLQRSEIWFFLCLVRSVINFGFIEIKFYLFYCFCFDFSQNFSKFFILFQSAHRLINTRLYIIKKIHQNPNAEITNDPICLYALGSLISSSFDVHLQNAIPYILFSARTILWTLYNVHETGTSTCKTNGQAFLLKSKMLKLIFFLWNIKLSNISDCFLTI